MESRTRSTDRLIVTSLTTTVAPSYRLPAIELGKDWGTGQIGTQVALGGGVTGIASFTAQVGQNGVVTLWRAGRAERGVVTPTAPSPAPPARPH